MNAIKTNRRTDAKSFSKRFIYLMAAFIAAAMTLVTCSGEDENENGENGENGGGSNVSGKRIKTLLQTAGPRDGSYRVETSYNSDGTIKRTDAYDENSKLEMYFIITSNPDGTRAKEEAYTAADNKLYYVFSYTYDSNKKPKKGDGTYYVNGVLFGTVTIDYTFQNGRKTREVFKTTSGFEPATVQYDFNYDNAGKRTTTTETHSLTGTRTYTRTYNPDGTLQKITYPFGYNNSDNGTVTKTYTWEDGKSTANIDDLLYW